MPLFPDFTRLYQADTPPAASVRRLAFRGSDLLVQEADGGVALPADTPAVRDLLTPYPPLTLGVLHDTAYLACELPPDAPVPPGWKTANLRSLYGQISETEWQIAGYAAQILHWRRTSGFCPVCGSPAGPMGKEWARTCTRCGHARYPHVSPAVLVLVHDGNDKILLAHKPGWGDRYSILAGFVLPGESLEECAQREVQEEVGAEVTDLVYAGSQPWPFPQQLMVGFTARYVRGELRLDEEELDHAAWFRADALPSLPPPLSLSRQMIDAWEANHHPLR